MFPVDELFPTTGGKDQFASRRLQGPVYIPPVDDSYDDESEDKSWAYCVGYMLGNLLVLCLLYCIVKTCSFFLRCRARRLAAAEGDSTVSQEPARMHGNHPRHRASSAVGPLPLKDETRQHLLRLFEPVRMLLEAKHFPGRTKPSPRVVHGMRSNRVQVGRQEMAEGTIFSQSHTTSTLQMQGNDEASVAIEIPIAGLHQNVAPEIDLQTRVVSGVCSICLIEYEIGSDIVWSSNALCEHVFHEQCIEEWLMTKHGAPTCPCCRRDFVVDPNEEELEA